jgi:3-oxoacyl-[acyl-carrier-protein] synthase II
VVVTGVGILSPVGIGAEENWRAITSGKSGLGPITRFDASTYKTRIAGEVKNFKPEEFIDKKASRRMDPFAQFAMAAARMAMESSGLKIEKGEAHRYGCIIGCGLGGLAEIEKTHRVLLERGPDRVSPFFIPMLIGNIAPGQVSIEWGLKGPNLCPATACAAGTHGVGQAFHLIRHGISDGALCGGVESVVTGLAVSGFNSMKALSTRNDDPERASRPFDLGRDGFVIGEGAGLLVLEELERAKARGANILAEIVGFGMSGDAYHMTAPPDDGEGAINCMRAALNDAGLEPGDIDYINAHGTSTELNDAIESRAIRTLFGDHANRLAVSSTKSMTGHLLGGGGGVEAVYTVLTLAHQVMPPTINYETPDPACDLDYVPNQARPGNIRAALSNSFGFGGTNGALVFTTYQG